MKRHEDKTENLYARVLRLYQKRFPSDSVKIFRVFITSARIPIQPLTNNYTIIPTISSVEFARAVRFADYVADGDFYPMERLGRNKSRWTGPAGGALFAETIVYGCTTFST